MEKKVLLFSGGFDSVLQEFLIKPDVLLYVDMKTSYSPIELEFLDTFSKHYKDRLIIKEFPLGDYERDNKYLPYRNLILGALAMQYGQHVYFGFNAADDAPDKDKEFMKRLRFLFEHLNTNCREDMGWDTSKFSFNAQYSALTKTQMVKKCLEKGMDVSFVQNIRTCYDSDSFIGCGKCRPCINKAIALINNGIFLPTLFDSPITKDTLRVAVEETIQDNHEGRKQPKKYVKEVRKAYRLLQ